MPERLELGHIEVIMGCMHAGKSEEAIRRARRAIIAKQNVHAFYPNIDTRRTPGTINTFDGVVFKAEAVVNSSDMAYRIKEEDQVIVIDEAQFFDDGVADLCSALANSGRRIIAAGLDRDFRGITFGPMGKLIERAEEVDVLHAICDVCKKPASFTQRLINGKPAHYDSPVIMVGDEYTSRCREHFILPGAPEHLRVVFQAAK